jgi:hypothetical protein
LKDKKCYFMESIGLSFIASTLFEFQERAHYRAIITNSISQRKKLFAEAKGKVETELKRVSGLFTKPENSVEEVRKIMDISHRARAAAEATHKVLERLLSKYFFTSVEKKIETLRDELRSQLADCKSTVRALHTSATKKSEVFGADD